MKLPARLMVKAGDLPFIGSDKLHSGGEALLKLHDKMHNLQSLFVHFISHEWIFETTWQTKFLANMTSFDRKEFNFDNKTIDWRAMMLKNTYGIRKFYIKEDCIMPVGEYSFSRRT